MPTQNIANLTTYRGMIKYFLVIFIGCFLVLLAATAIIIWSVNRSHVLITDLFSVSTNQFGSIKFSGQGREVIVDDQLLVDYLESSFSSSREPSGESGLTYVCTLTLENGNRMQFSAHLPKDRSGMLVEYPLNAIRDVRLRFVPFELPLPENLERTLDYLLMQDLGSKQ